MGLRGAVSLSGAAGPACGRDRAASSRTPAAETAPQAGLREPLRGLVNAGCRAFRAVVGCGELRLVRRLGAGGAPPTVGGAAELRVGHEYGE
jgi:hypothetical protein